MKQLFAVVTCVSFSHFCCIRWRNYAPENRWLSLGARVDREPVTAPHFQFSFVFGY